MDEKATKAFNELKLAMESTPFLKLPDDSMEFTAKTDASNIGIGAVLTKGGIHWLISVRL